MGNARIRNSIAIALTTALLLGGSFNAAAAGPTAQQDWAEYCAPCHGQDAKGHGKLLYTIPQIKPSDLTQLSKRHDGKFPADEVAKSIDGRIGIPSHTRFDMPFFGVKLQKPGQEFSAESNAEVGRRISNLVGYIESIQEK